MNHTIMSQGFDNMCVYCGSHDIVKNGILYSSGQRYRCRDKNCKRSFTIGGKRRKYNYDQKKYIINQTYNLGYKKTSKIYQVSPNTILSRKKWFSTLTIKKFS